MPKTIITEELVKKAIELARPMVEGLMNEGIGVWGPKHVAVSITYPGLDGILEFFLGYTFLWDPKWGEEVDFMEIARQKMKVCQRTGMPSDVVVTREPWLLEEGDFLYQGGTAVRPGGLAVGVSGAYPQVDEGISNIIYDLIVMLCRLKVRELQENEINRLE
jgi:hypothetical protein